VYKAIVKVLEKYYCFNLSVKSVNKYHGVRHTLSVTLIDTFSQQTKRTI